MSRPAETGRRRMPAHLVGQLSGFVEGVRDQVRQAVGMGNDAINNQEHVGQEEAEKDRQQHGLILSSRAG